MFNVGKSIKKMDLQSLFSQRASTLTTHPEMETRATRTEFVSDQFDIFSNDEYENGSSRESNQEPYSLQVALAETFQLFLDKSETIDRWSCGLDLSLETWRENWFGR